MFLLLLGFSHVISRQNSRQNGLQYTILDNVSKPILHVLAPFDTYK